MKNPLLSLVLILLLLTPESLLAGLKIYYIRHIECGHNITRTRIEKEWPGVPKDQLPKYVGNPNMMTPQGEKEQGEATEKLLKMTPFDLVAVSPLWRTRTTVRPYLKEKGLKAEIWPEIMEAPIAKPEDFVNPTPSPDLFAGLREIATDKGSVAFEPGELESFFIIRPDATKTFKMTKPSDGAVLAEKALALLKERFGGQDKSVLLVGHALSGTNLIRVILKDPNFNRGLLNAKLWMAEEQADGTFKLITLNDEPYEPRGSKTQAEKEIHP